MTQNAAGPSRTAWIVALIALGLFVPLTLVVSCASQPYFAFDLAVSRSIQSVHSPVFETAMHLVSLADNNVAGPSVLIALACVVLLACRAWREAAMLVAVVLIGQGLWVACGWLVNRPRPDPELIHVLIEADNVHGFPSYPSGHCVYYTAYFGFLWYLSFTRVRIAWLRCLLLSVLAVPVLLVGFARLFLGAHWVTDVIGGYLLGAAVLACGIAFYRRWQVPQ